MLSHVRYGLGLNVAGRAESAGRAGRTCQHRMPAQGATKVDMGPEAAGKCAPQKAGSPGRKRTSAKPQQHRAYASWEDENKENIDPRTRKATATSLEPKALSSTTAANVVKPTRARRRRNAIVPVGSPRCVSDLQNAFAALAVASSRR